MPFRHAQLRHIASETSIRPDRSFPRWRAIAEGARGWNENESPQPRPKEIPGTPGSHSILQRSHRDRATFLPIHFPKNPDTLAEHGFGLKIYNSRALLEGWGQTIHNKTATDKLPKITETKRAALKAAMQTYTPIRREFQHPANRAFIG